MRARAPLVATSAAVFALAGCKDLGLENRNYPHEQAAHRPPDALVMAVHPETRPAHVPAAAPHETMVRPISVGGQLFMASGGAGYVPGIELKQVGGGPTGAVSAAAWDEPPYDRLYLSHPGGLYISYLPVYDDSGDPAARLATAKHTLESGAPAAH